MKRVILIYGLISGLIVAVLMAVNMQMVLNGPLNFDNGTLAGYTTMVIALSLVFFGIKSYRDNYLNGSITFGTAFKVGILITLIASVMYCISWEIGYSTVFSDFIEKWSEHYIAGVKKSGASEAEVNAAAEELKTSFEMYKNPVIRFGMTMMEILPVGLIITLLSAALLRKKEILPAA